MSTIIQRSFAGGEITPALYARVDTAKYAAGLRTCRNFLVMRHGGAQNRAGSVFVQEVKDSTKTVRLIPFIFNADQTYVLEFGDQYMRVIKDGDQQTLAAQNITAITNGNPGLVTYSGADTFANGDEIYISGVVGAMAPNINGRNFKVASVNTGSNVFQLAHLDGSLVDTSLFGAYSSGGTIEEVYTITTPYLEADLPEIQYVQSADVITLVHPSYEPRELSRLGDTNWNLSPIVFEPSIAAPTGIATGGAAGVGYSWVVTSIADGTFEESLPPITPPVASSTNPAVTPVTVSWVAVAGASSYNVYRGLNGIFGFIGTAGGTSFIDLGAPADTTSTPPNFRDLFNATGDYPSTVGYYQERLVFANSNNAPETVWASRSGAYKNFTTSTPLQADDAVTFTIVGRQVNEVRHIVDLGTLLLLTSGAEHICKADVLTPTDIGRKQQDAKGSSTLAPLICDGSAIFVQARGNKVRDIGFQFATDGYRGNDLTIFASHLFDKFAVTDWALAQAPNPIIWAVRNDGTLLGLSYVKEQQIVAWHHHDTGSVNSPDVIEGVCVVPEGNEDVLYLVVKRQIGPVSPNFKRYIERVSSRLVRDITDSIFLDAALSYDGTNEVSTTMTLSGGTLWTHSELLTLTASASFFSAADVGNAIHLTDLNGAVIRFRISGYSSATVVTGHAHKTVPVGLRFSGTQVWAKAVDTVTGLWHLEGLSVGVVADGFVVANPNVSTYTPLFVAGGQVTLDRPYAKIHVGLPYISDLETLDVDGGQNTIADKKINVQKVTMHVEETRGIFAGPRPPSDDTVDPLEDLYEVTPRNITDDYEVPAPLITDKMTVLLKPEWNSNGRVFVRQVDPVPATILSVIPAGNFP